MLRQNIQIIEHLLAILFILQTLFPSYFSTPISLTCFAALLVAKYLLEGFRATIFVIFFIQFILLFTRSLFIGLPLSALMYAAILYFPVYKYPEPMGKYKVGYKTLLIPGVTNIGVFYPTTQKTEDVKHSPYHQSWFRIPLLWNFFAEYHDAPSIPEILFRAAFNFLEYQSLGVNKDAKIAQEAANKKFPVVVFSHGLSANIHIYSLNLKEWASNGFIVFSVDHDEQLRFLPSQLTDYPSLMRLRGGQLEDRKVIVKKVLDLISKPSTIHGLFENNQIVLDYDNIFASGHSFGGATASEVAIEDSRITGGLLILDPWFECARFDILYQPINKPVLSIRSNVYDKEMTGELSRKHAKANCGNGMGLSGYFAGSAHNTCTDLPMLLPRELMLFGVIQRMDDIEESVKYQTSLTRNFLEAALEYNRNGRDEKDGMNLKDRVLKEWRKEIKEIGVNDVLFVDE